MSIETLVTAYFDNMAAMNPEGWISNFATDAISYDPVRHLQTTRAYWNPEAMMAQLRG